jgi:hypothetical protein
VRGNGGAAPDDDDFPAALRRCLHCGRGDGVQQWDLDGRSVWLHDRCQGAWADKQAP